MHYDYLRNLFYRTNLERNKGGLGKMKIPILSDITKQISKDYGILLEDQGVSLRLVMDNFVFLKEAIRTEVLLLVPDMVFLL